MSAGNLREWLAETIREYGPMPIDRFMHACLLHERFGYYRHRQAIGARGDFVTAPEISQVFGELIGIWVASAWAALGSPLRWRLIELGPGRGALMADLLRALTVLPAARAGAEVVLVEANPVLAAQQRGLLAGCDLPVHWLQDAAALQALPVLPTILIANEFLDALPIRQHIALAGRWRERCVILDGTMLAFGPGDGVVEAAREPDGTIREVMSGACALVAQLLKARDPTYHLYIDYGHLGPVYGDTLQAVQGHRFADPLLAAGEADVSVQVDFTQVLEAARAAGADAYGPVSQAALLGRLGAAERVQRLVRDADAVTAHALQTGIARLMQPAGMGGRFNAIALASKGLAAPPVF